ncbi:hypothetical protein ABVF61_22355 [Roseibium sp. HPY-6]|uniref:hypothetical protein n=1 Tax=Roseibium sp. HPY-6 TaxID=3229852 RepID=UPI0033901033
MKNIFLTIITTIILSISSAYAAPVTYKYQALVTFIEDRSGNLSQLELNSIVTGEFTYLSGQSPVFELFEADFFSFGTLLGASAEFAGVSATAGPGEAFLKETNASVQFGLRSNEAGDAGTGLGYDFTNWAFDFATSDKALFQNQMTPEELNLPDFDELKSFVFLGGTYLGNDFFAAQLTSLTRVTPVPVPATIFLLAGALGVLGCASRTRRISLASGR